MSKFNQYLVRRWRLLCVIGVAAAALMFIAIVNSQVVTVEPSPMAGIAPVPVMLDKTPVPVSFTLPIFVTVAWIASIATGLAGIAVISRFIVKSSAIIHDLHEYGPVIVSIAKEFQSDSGNTLKDSINRLEKSAIESKAAAALAESMVKNMTDLILQIQVGKAKT